MCSAQATCIYMCMYISLHVPDLSSPSDYDSDGPEMEDVRRIIQPLELDSYLDPPSSHH